MANPNQDIKYTKLFIDNTFVDSKSGKTFPTINPANKKVLANIAEGDKADVDAAVDAAERAFQRGSVWRNLDASGRGKLIYKLADLLERDMLIVANLEALDNGKTFKSACGDVFHSVGCLRYYAGYADKITGTTIPADYGFFAMTRREPIGVVGQIIPWNYPLMMLVWKWGPALAAGCTIVMKPAEQTPLTALYIAALSKEAGFPDGVINVIPGYGPTAGHAISAHPKIRKVAFTGSVEVGQIIMQTAAKTNLKKVSLELGGKSPLVVMDDVDVKQAARTAHDAIFTNHGQSCIAASRTFVHEKIYDEFVQHARQLAKERKVGNQFEDVLQGPQIDEEMYFKVMSYIESGKKEGANVQVGGNCIGKNGFFIEPTVFSDVTDDMKISREEIFGPVQSILKFNTLDEVIERANRTNYGLAAGILTNNIDTALTYAKAVEAGSVWVNCYAAVVPQVPFGGYKQSGSGRELGENALELYLETKSISIKLPTSH